MCTTQGVRLSLTRKIGKKRRWSKEVEKSHEKGCRRGGIYKEKNSLLISEFGKSKGEKHMVLHSCEVVVVLSQGVHHLLIHEVLPPR